MTVWIDKKYTKIVGLSLDRFQVKKETPFAAQCRCPYCGDSQKSKTKTRGNFFEHKQSIFFKCFNCSISKSISSFLYDQSPQLFKEWKFEVVKETGNNVLVEVKQPIKEQKPKIDNVLKDLKKISQLPFNHPAKTYIEKRKIPSNTHFRLYYVTRFFTWVNSLIPGKFSDTLLKSDSPRLVIPFFDKNGNVFGFQGRSFDPKDTLRYITIMLEEREKIFGLDQLDTNKTHYIVEGPLDSLFVHNAVAMAGSDGNFEQFVNKNNCVICMDNEPRSKEIVSKVNKYISDGWKVCIWPSEIQEKDINDMVLAGHVPNWIIDNNTFSGLTAKMKLTQWSKL